MSEDPSSRDSQSMPPWSKMSMQVSNDYYNKSSSSNQAVTNEVANTISL